MAVYALAYRGGVQGYRLVLVGIGVGMMLLALTDYLLTRARLEDAQQARGVDRRLAERPRLGAGRPAGRRAWPCSCRWRWLLSRPLAMLELGDDAASALGVSVERTRLALALVAVGLTALATAAAGPIGFVALAAPQIARRLTRALGTRAAVGRADGRAADAGRRPGRPARCWRPSSCRSA